MKSIIKKLTQFVSAQLANFNATDTPTLVMEHGTASTARTSEIRDFAAKNGGKLDISQMPAGEVAALLGSKTEIERMQAELHRILGNKKNNQIVISKIFAVLQENEEIVANLAKNEADIAIAEHKYEEAKRGDGISDLELTYTRNEDARRALEILRIVANGNAAKLAEVEDAIDDLVVTAAPMIADYLEQMSHEEAEKIKKHVLPVFGEASLGTASLKTLIDSAPGVSAPWNTARRIRTSMDSEDPPGLIINIWAARNIITRQ